MVNSSGEVSLACQYGARNYILTTSWSIINGHGSVIVKKMQQA
uniref:Uncharacterized protein n=1 Tax=Anopheles arabiensis TaxID=7173 RepID=A0A182IGE4_ANOAR